MLAAQVVDLVAHVGAELLAHGAALALANDGGLLAKVEMRRSELVLDALHVLNRRLVDHLVEFYTPSTKKAKVM